jgi:uncharacterized protein (DUF849 family)
MVNIAEENRFVVNLTPTGMIPTRAMSPHVPLTPAQIVDDVVSCLQIGVTSVHLHARDERGLPTWKPEIYATIIDGIRNQAPDLVIGVSCSGRDVNEFEKRSAVLDLRGDLKPDMASLTLSSLNFNKQTSVNTPQMIQDLAKKMADRGIKPELEVFDIGMINYSRYLAKKRLIEPPFAFNLILGNIACAQADILHAGIMLRELPPDSLFNIGGIGGWQLKMNILAVLEGGGARVGLEDNIYFDERRTKLATNAALVDRIVHLAGALNRTVMKPSELRSKLQLQQQ